MENPLRLRYLTLDQPVLQLSAPIGDQEALKRLTDLFYDLSQTQAYEVRVDEQDFIEPSGGVQLTARCKGRSIFGYRKGIIYCSYADDLKFDWVHEPEEWEDFAGLIEGLTRSSGSGYQYLSSSPAGDALVIVSKGEHF